MNSILSKREYREELTRPFLQKIWYVDADHTYSVTKRNGDGDGYIAVRTLTGMGRLKLREGNDFELPSGSLGIFEAKEIRSYASGNNGWQFYWFAFQLDQLPPVFLNQTMNIHISAQEHIELERCFQSLNRNSACECMIAESLFSYLLADWQLHVTQTEYNGITIQEILALLEKGHRERIGIAALAREAGMCERKLRNIVRKATGLSPTAYMLSMEMAAAMELLRTTSMTISEIAVLFNYSSPFYFSRVFKKHYGHSPQQVRDSIKQ